MHMELVSASGWPGIVTEDFEVIMQAGPVEKVEQIVDQYKNKQGYGPSPDRQVDEEKKRHHGRNVRRLERSCEVQMDEGCSHTIWIHSRDCRVI